MSLTTIVRLTHNDSLRLTKTSLDLPKTHPPPPRSAASTLHTLRHLLRLFFLHHPPGVPRSTLGGTFNYLGYGPCSKSTAQFCLTTTTLQINCRIQTSVPKFMQYSQGLTGTRTPSSQGCMLFSRGIRKNSIIHIRRKRRTWWT
jgi:hypothetical protein